MSNFLWGIAIGWMIFTQTGRDAVAIAYYYATKAQLNISERVQEDLPAELPLKRERK
jgi:hypothetical protein